MANIFDKILFSVEKAVKGVSLAKHAQEIAERVYRRTKTGQGLTKTERGAGKQKLKALSDKYKTSRKKNKDELHPTTKPSKSNLTKTGQLLAAIKGKANNNRIIIFLKENRNDGKKNSDIVGWQEDQGRPFFELSDKELKGLQNQIKRDLIKSIKRR